MIWIGNADPDSAPSPLLPALGMNFPLVERRFFALETGMLLTGTYYEYARGRAIPAELEQRDFVVPLILGDLRAGLHLPMGSKVRLGLTAGLLLALRLPIPLGQDAAENFGSTLTYLLMRAAYPEAEVFVQFPVLPSFDFRVGVRSAWPWFHLWDGEPFAFWDQLLVSGVLGVIWRLPEKTVPAD